MFWLFLLLFFVFFFWFYFRPERGLYLVIFLAPFLGLTIDFSSFSWAKSIPYLENFDAPVADFLVLILFAVICLKTGRSFFCSRGNESAAQKRDRPVWPFSADSFQKSAHLFFLPFFLVGLLSLSNVSADQFNISLKYLVRPILFSYLMWIVLPIILIDTKKTLERAIKVFFCAGFLSAVMGLFSLFINAPIFGFWQRAAPLIIGPFAPLGANHNLLAEILVAALPLAFYLFVKNSGQAKKFYFISLILIAVIALLTFARAAWLALLTQSLIYFAVSYRGQEKLRRLRQWFWPILLVVPLAVYMVLFSLSPIVRSSNATRLDLTGIAWTYFKLHPWLGNGVGIFVPLVESTRLFTVEYGDPLDAHGIIQKLLAEQGLLGLITFFIFVGWILARLWQGWHGAEEKHKMLLLCFFLSVVGAFVYQLFNTSYYNAHLWLPVGLALAGAELINKDIELQERAKANKIFERGHV